MAMIATDHLWYKVHMMTERRHEWKKGINIAGNKTSLWNTLEGLPRVNPSHTEKYLHSFMLTKILHKLKHAGLESSNNSPYGQNN